MSFLRIRTIKKRQYLYRETRKRKGKRVVSTSQYLGPVGGWLKAQCSSTYGIDWDAIERQQWERMDREEAEHKAHIAKIEKELGVKLGPPGVDPVPIEKPATQANLSARTDDAKEAQANVGSEKDVEASGKDQAEPDVSSPK